MNECSLLLVENDVTVRDALTKALVAENHTVVGASSSEAIQKFNANPVDVVLLDLNPADEEGWDVFRALKKRRSGLPIIVTSSQPDRLAHSLVSEATAGLQKPFEVSVLLRLLKQATRPQGLVTGLARALSSASTMLLAVCFYFLCGTSAKAVSTTFQITGLEVQNANVIVRWQGGGTTNQLQRKSSLTGPWENVGLPTTASSATNPIAGPIAFFRVMAITNSSGADTIAPTVSMLSPSAGSIISGTVALTAAASDNLGGSGVARVEFYRDNAVLLRATTTAPYTAGFDTTVIANGSHSFYAKAYDALGNPATSVANTFTVNNSVQLAGPWAKGFGGTSYNYGQAVAVEAITGNLVLAGCFAGTADYGSGPLTSAGLLDMVLAKYSPTGAHLWSRRFGATGNEQPKAVAVDGSGNILVAGIFTGTANVGGSDLVSAGGSDIFLAKYSPSGNHLWSKRFGGSAEDIVNGLVVDLGGNVNLTGTFSSMNMDVTFGGQTFYSYYGNENIFVTKLSGADGSHIWSKGWPTYGRSKGSGVAVDSSGNVFVTGYQIGYTEFGGAVGRLTCPSSTPAALVLKLSNADGAPIWGKLFGGTTTTYGERGVGVVVDSSGNPVVLGTFQTSPSVNFGNGQVLANASMMNQMFLIKLSGDAGVCSWAAQSVNLQGETAPTALALDPSGNITVAGTFQYRIKIGSTTLASLTGLGNVYGFVAKFSGSGGFLWANQLGGSTSGDSVGINAVATDGNANPFVTGYFQGNVGFNGTTLTSHSSYDAFLLKLAP